MAVNTGVYMIINKVNGKFYVGSTQRARGFVRRFKEHANLLNKGRHPNKILQRAWNKYGSDSFSFEILQCSEKDVISLEQKFIDSLSPAYNIAKIARAPMTGRKHTEESKNKIRAHGPPPNGKKGTTQHIINCVKAHGGDWIVCTQTGEIFPGCAIVDRTFGLAQSRCHQIVNGKRRSSKGWSFFKLEKVA